MDVQNATLAGECEGRNLIISRRPRWGNCGSNGGLDVAAIWSIPGRLCGRTGRHLRVSGTTLRLSSPH